MPLRILAIDIGNTHIVAGCILDGSIEHIARLSSDRSRTEYEYAATMNQILSIRGVRGQDIDGAIISSVVPGLTRILQAAVRLFTGGRESMVVGAGVRTGLNIRIEDPGTLGSDLVVASVAANATYPAPIIIFDMGTATTISVIDAQRSYLGGAIYPGVDVAFSALSGGTSQLPDISIEAPKKTICTNTTSCMQSGAVFGTASMVDGMIDRIQAELGAKATVVATGGLARRIVPHCRHQITVDEDLLLRGLWIVYTKNTRR